ncbi:MAG: 50S ribosomal protein L29 [Paludibacteraceae bacterium]|nr:50S ribosomal protein L29 [Paludibacteraceae bacterium]MBR2260640.1 50S ribosomal protein L29 [Paludibacteraceae bacterium]MEE3484027.1 50S ribosomal protein L29 [Bacteroidales bacterium]
MKLADFKKEIKGLSTQELQDKLAAEKEALVRMKLNHSVSPLNDPSQLKAIRKNIARMNTELSLRENK